RYVLGPSVNRNTKVWKEFVEDHPGQVAIQQAQHDVAWAQAESVRALDDIRDLLPSARREVSAYWIDEATGELCRCRPDAVAPVGDEGASLNDGKTYSDAGPREFARQVWRKGYHRQDAWYSEGYARASGLDVLAFVFVAVETAWPFAASAHVLSDE